MRYLSKVILINSAGGAVPYAEVNLNGNVHLTGTQGVGKSTLLRTVLFFYNADSRKLGISTSKKRYAAYYFPHHNSYIIYEVTTEHRAYCILSFKPQNQNGVAYRFIDTAYEDSYFINENEQAMDWDGIRKRLDQEQVRYSNIVSSYTDYKNILYGGGRNVDRRFRDYALFSSKNYENVPRTISNVFLNDKLDARFMKETIIRSLSDSETSIRLNTYASHLKDFEDQINDIRLWTDTNKKGQNRLRQQAAGIQETYLAIESQQKRLYDTASQLGYALHIIQKEKPILENRQQKLATQKEEAEKQRNEHLQQYNEEKSRIDKEMGSVEAKLKTSKQKRELYDKKGIDELLALDAREGDLKLKKTQLETEHKSLTAKYENITQQYDRLEAEAEGQFIAYKNSKEAQKNSSRLIFRKRKKHSTSN